MSAARQDTLLASWTAAGYLLCVALLVLDGARILNAIVGAP